MAINIDHNNFISFNSNLSHNVKQMASKLRGAVTEVSEGGERFTRDKLTSPVDVPDVVASQHADTVVSDISHNRRSGFPVDFVHTVMLDSEDKLRLLADPTSEYCTEVAAMFNRKIDDIILDTLLGDAYTGKNGTTTLALPSSQQIAHGSAALTVAKLQSARKILAQAHVDFDRDKMNLVVNASGMEDLQSASELKSTDFVAYQSVQSGQVPMVMGFKVMEAERITSYTGASAASTNRPAIVFSKDAVILNMVKDIYGEVVKNPSKNNNWQITYKMTVAALRLHDEKVVDIRFQE
jgi:hypothetical protein